MCTTVLAFTWLLATLAWLLMLIQQTSYPQNHPLGPSEYKIYLAPSETLGSLGGKYFLVFHS